MSSFELSKLQATSAPRALSESDRSQLTKTAALPEPAATKAGQAPGIAVEVTAPAKAGEPPFDKERVEEIRKALRDDTYPLVPAKITDAIIAARVSPGIMK